MNAEQVSVEIDKGSGRGLLLSLMKKHLPGLAAALVSGLMNRAVLPGGYLPLGAGFMAAVPRKYAAAAAVGGVIGCLTDAGTLVSVEGLRHVSSLLAVAGIRWALGELRSVNRAKFYPFFAALAGVLMTGTVISGSKGSVFSYPTLYFAIEGVVAGLAAMFFSEAWRASERFGSGERLTRSAAVSLVITLCAAAIPICRLRIAGFSPGMALVHTAVLLAAFARRETGGSAAGIAAGGIAFLSRSAQVQGAVIPVAALLAGYAGFYGRIFAASVYTACCLMGELTAGSLNFFFVAEAAAGAVMSCVIPAAYAERALAAAGFCGRGIYSAPRDDAAARMMREASEAVSGICEVMGKVSDGLEKRSLPDDDAIYRRAVSEVCGRCALREGCAGDGAGRLAGRLKKGRSVSGSEISAALGKQCVREDELAGEINRGYGYYLASRSAFSRMAAIRSVVNGQLEGVGMMLERLGEDLAAELSEDGYSSHLVYEALTARGYEVSHCVCREERGGRMTVSLRVRSRDNGADVEKIAAFVSGSLGMDFETERLERDRNMLDMTLSQRRKFSLVCAVVQHCCGGEKLCGDSYVCAENGHGKGYMLLSDGMGSGGRAAVEGALTCELFRRLLDGGFDFDSSVKIVNSELMIKSEDETLSTADCLEINLFNGRSVISKAGAAQSYHVRKGFVSRIDLPSLPLGILCETDTADYSFTAEDGDMIVMISDGVPTDESMWFENMLRSNDVMPERDFAELLLQNAVSRRPEGEDDDITVAIGRIVYRRG